MRPGETWGGKPAHFTLGDLNMSRRFLEVAQGIPRRPCLSGVGAEQVRGGTVAPWPAMGAETLDTKWFSGCRLKLVDEVVAPATILNSARKKSKMYPEFRGIREENCGNWGRPGIFW